MTAAQTALSASESFAPAPRKPKRVAVSQSNYVPWKGYFDFINSVDEFVLLDDVQFTKRDWRNRNRLKGPAGPCWISIPIHVKGRYLQKINEAEISDPDWPIRHWKTIEGLYARAPWFKTYKEDVRALYMQARMKHLTDVNKFLLRGICDLLGIGTRLLDSREFTLVEGRTERLLELCRQLSATSYYCGPRSRDYLEECLFHEAGIEVVYMNYDDYPEYPQLFGPFIHDVSILDLIFNTGADARKYMKT